MLDHIKIASPCSADWNRMEGTERVRFCAECKKNVYNISEMTRRDAEALLQGNADICARVFRRADGTVLTEDCPVGLRTKIARAQKRLGWAVAGAFSLASAWGQSSGVMSGKVTDPTGATVAAVKITITDPKTGKSESTKSDADGLFKIDSLPSGTYTVVAETPGFARYRDDAVRVPPAGDVKFNVTLSVGYIGTVVDVTRKPKPWWRRIF